MTELPPALAEHTGYLLHRAHQRAAEIVAVEFRSSDDPRHVGVLGALATRGPHSQSQLGKWLGVNRTAMVQLIDDLERAGLVKRLRNAEDRRSYDLHITPDGERTLERLKPHADRVDATLTALLEPEERARLNALLRALLLSDLETRLLDSLRERTGYLISKAHFRHRRIGDEAFAPLGIDVRDFGTLTALASAGPLSQQALARQFAVSGTIVVQIIDELERSGLVERRRNPLDRRSYALELTDAGRELQARARTVLDGAADALTGAIGAEGDRELGGLLRKLLSAGRVPSPPVGATPRPAT